MERPAGYRADVDGLRAVAVLSVVLYHINNAWVPGGYVGVDIFFVISGFLITRNIWGELQAGHFSLADFYLRRIRRIAPAFLVVTAVTLLAGMLLLLPADLLRLAKSAVWAAFSAANVYYWKYLDTDYFAAATAEEPLLHLWSLGVEEQFYLIWPVLLMALVLSRRARPLTVATTIAICIGSFAIAEMTNVSAQKFSYYMLPPRAGELMLGALLAFFAPARDTTGASEGRGWVGEAAAVLGMGLVGFSLWRLDDTSPFPGINAVYPCLGAVLLIFSGQQGSRLTRALLASPPVVYIGLISYSLYLWHWPILAFIRYFYGEISPQHALIAAVAMLGLAAASYRFVEQPARRARGAPLRQVLALFIGPVAAISIASMALIYTDGMRATIESNEGFIAASAELNSQTSASSRAAFPCTDSKSSLSQTLRARECVLGANRAAPTVFLWGDSNAAHYIGALEAVAKHERFAFRYVALSTCPAVFGAGEFGAGYARDRCDKFREGVRRYLAGGQIGTVVLAAQWSVHDSNPQLREALDATIEELKQSGKHVVLLGQVPGFVGYGRECEQRWMRLGSGDCEARLSRPPGKPLIMNGYLEGLATHDPSVSYVDIEGVLCKNGSCSPYLDGVPVYYNPTHLSAAGSYRIGREAMDTPERDAWQAAFEAASASRNAVLAEGYTPGFPHKIRSQRHDPLRGGQYQHVVIAEFLNVDDHSVAESLVSDLEGRGMVVEGPIENQDAVRYVADKGELSLTVDIHASPSMPLLATGARGIISFAWRDQQSR